jgi:alkylation response protein AidB-like acyl-CoA dehydrogenase
MKLGMNHPMGPLALADFIGLDTCLAILEVLHEGSATRSTAPVRCSRSTSPPAGTGRKSGRGFYTCARRLMELLALTEEQRAIRRRRAPSPTSNSCPLRRASGIATAVLRSRRHPQAGELGFLGMLIPEAYDGLGLDARSVSDRPRGDRRAPMRRSAVLMSVHNSLPTQMLLRYGQRGAEAALPRADGARRVARCLRPLRAGRRVGRERLCAAQAVRDGDDWILDRHQGVGQRSGTHADVILAMARTDTPE